MHSKVGNTINSDLYNHSLDAAGGQNGLKNENSLCVFGNANSEDPIRLLQDNTQNLEELAYTVQ